MKSVPDRSVRRFLLGCFLLFACLFISRGQGKATVFEYDPLSATIRYVPGSYRPETVLVDSLPHLYFAESEVSGNSGNPGLPVETFLVGIPPSGEVQLSVVSEQWITLVDAKIAPIPEISITDDPFPSVVKTFTRGPVSAPARATASVGEIRWFRYQRIAVVEVHPYRLNPSTGTLERLVAIDLKFMFSDANLTGGTGSVQDPLFESTYAGILSNYVQAKQWRVQTMSAGITGSADSTATWFDTFAQYVRIPVPQDGVYKITYNQLLSAGVLPVPADPRSLDVFYKGKRLAIRSSGEEDGTFGPGDFFEFYGSRLYESDSAVNEFTDTSVYWATFTGSGSRRTQIDSVVAGSPDATIQYFSHMIRAEKDSFYFFGNGGLPTNNTSDKVFGEGWYWRKLLANQTTSISVTSANFYRSGNPSYTVRGRIHSPVINTATPNHDIEVLVNGTLIGNVQFAGSKDTVFSLAAASVLFLEGQNTVSIRSKQTAASLNEVFVDWITINSLKTLTVENDTLLFDGSQAVQGQVALFQLTGFSNQNISVYRVDADGSLEKQFVGSVSGSSAPFTFLFTDTVSTAARYIALTENRKRSGSKFSKKTFVNLRSTANGADYLIITARELMAEATRLALYRSQRGIGRTKIVLVDDIYDEFNFGMFDPFALRRFVLAADSLWVPPRPAYVVLLGDANWDYRDNLRTGKRNLVPSLGNPVSDAWIVAAQNDVFLPEKKVGRIPAATVQEAAFFVDMIQEYEASPLSRWNKRFLFMASGFDSSETVRFRTFSEGLITQNITPPPISGETARLYRTSPVIEFEQTAEVRRVLESGAVWMNFYGHAGTDFWGNGLSDPAQFVNLENKRHLISDISCSTVRFGEPLVQSFSEKLLFGQAGGASAYLGSSGFGYETPLRTIATSLFQRFAVDTVRELGTLLLNAKVVLRGSGTIPLLSQQALQQMTLLGDPATRLRIAEKPDLTVETEEITVTPDQPSEVDEKVTLILPIHNIGLYAADSVEIRLTHSIGNEPPIILDMKRGPLGLLDTVKITHPSFVSGGFHSVTVTLDPDNLFQEESETNNTAQFTYFVGSGQIRIVAPLNSSVVNPDSVVLIIQNPNLPATARWNGLFEIDTSSGFGSGAKVAQGGIVQGKVTTRWTVPAGILSDTTVYFWRAILTDGSDSTNWASGSFLTNRNARARWIQDRASLFRGSGQTQVAVGPSVTLLSRKIPLQAYSAGFTDGNDAAVWVDGVNISQGFANRGYNVAVLNQNSGDVEFFGAFSIYSDFTDTTLTEPLIQFLQGIPFGKRVIVAVADEGSRNKTERLDQALESIGSASIRSLGFRGSWAIIGRKGAGPGSVPEGLSIEGGGPVTLVDTVLFQNIEGTLTSPEIGPAARWIDISVETETSAVTRAVADLFRNYGNGARDSVIAVPVIRDSLLRYLPDSVLTLQIRLRLESDSAGLSPKLLRWWADFDRAPELAVNYQSVRIVKDSVLEGTDLSLEAEVFNIGGTSADSVSVSVGTIENNVSTSFYQTVLTKISEDSFQGIQTKLSTAGKRGKRLLFLQADPDARIRESTKADNLVSFSAFVATDTIPPSFDITFDGIRILDGDYVRGTPEIRIGIEENSPLGLTDPNSVIVKLDNQRITLGSTPDSLFEPTSGAEMARVTLRPMLQKGTHLLSVQVLDASGNPSDSVAAELRFRVETETKLLNVVNIPNPFSRETAFTFQLTGTVQPEEVRLRIFTVGGRLIYDRTLYPGEIQLGFNRIVWDGRDRDGDDVANGVYFYKIVARVGGGSVEVIEKLARVR